MWRETTKHERNRKIFEEEIDKFLPGRILDFHVHLLNEGVVPENETCSCAGHEINRYAIEDLVQDLSEVYPGRDTKAVCFGFPHPGYDFDSNNGYIAEKCDGSRFFALRLFDPHETPEIVRKDLSRGRFLGIKPYPDYVGKSSLAKVEVREMLPDWVLEIVNELGLIILLHLPRPGRLADPLNQSQVIEISERYPDAKIVLAHVGRAYYLKNATAGLMNLKNLPNVYFDLAMLNNPDVLEHLFESVPADRILYGTDIPLAIAPGKSVEINNQYTYITPVPWELSICSSSRKLTFTSFLYEELRAIRTAVERLGLSDKFAQGLFYDNGMRLLKSIELPA